MSGWCFGSRMGRKSQRGYENSKNRLGTAEKDSAAPGLFYFALAFQAQYKAIGARICYAISSAYSYQKWYRILSL